VVGKAGLIFPEGDVDALARHIQMLCENPDLGRQLGQEGYNRVITMYSQEQIAARMLQVYQQVIEC
jgi:glycosyltransferase involved in cell wall biosynthesis